MLKLFKREINILKNKLIGVDAKQNEIAATLMSVC